MSSNTVDVASELGTFLSSRRSAAALRQRVESGNLPILIDLSGVQALSESFADEFFAVLVQDRGHEWFAANVSVKGLAGEIRHTVLRAIHLRCETQPVG